MSAERSDSAITYVYLVNVIAPTRETKYHKPVNSTPLHMCTFYAFQRLVNKCGTGLRRHLILFLLGYNVLPCVLLNRFIFLQ